MWYAGTSQKWIVASYGPTWGWPWKKQGEILSVVGDQDDMPDNLPCAESGLTGENIDSQAVAKGQAGGSDSRKEKD